MANTVRFALSQQPRRGMAIELLRSALSAPWSGCRTNRRCDPVAHLYNCHAQMVRCIEWNRDIGGHWRFGSCTRRKGIRMTTTHQASGLLQPSGHRGRDANDTCRPGKSPSCAFSMPFPETIDGHTSNADTSMIRMKLAAVVQRIQSAKGFYFRFESHSPGVAGRGQKTHATVAKDRQQPTPTFSTDRGCRSIAMRNDPAEFRPATTNIPRSKRR